MFENNKAKKYVNEIFKTANRCSTYGLYLASVDQDFLEFEFIYYCYFIYDYHLLHKLDAKMRKMILDEFFKKILSYRTELTMKFLGDSYNNRLDVYQNYRMDNVRLGDFLSKCAEHITTLVSICIDSDGYHDGNSIEVEQAKVQITPRVQTKHILESMTVITSPMILQTGLRV